MDFSKRDFKEIEKIGQILNRVDKIDQKYVDWILGELSNYQPFLLSLILGYQPDLKQPEFEEIMKMYFIIWEFFKDKKNSKKIKLTQKQFENLEKKNLYFFKYLENSESTDKEFAITNDLENTQPKALLTGIFYRFNSQPVLLAMDEENKGLILLGIKSIIDCFEEIGKE